MVFAPDPLTLGQQDYDEFAAPTDRLARARIVARQKALEKQATSEFQANPPKVPLAESRMPRAEAVEKALPPDPSPRPRKPATGQQEAKPGGFEAWKQRYAPNDSGYDYDFRGAYEAGLTPGPNGHWADTFKRPWHPTFSIESKYATGEDARFAGRWDGETFIPPEERFPPSRMPPEPGFRPDLELPPPPDPNPTQFDAVDRTGKAPSLTPALDSVRQTDTAPEGFGPRSGETIARMVQRRGGEALIGLANLADKPPTADEGPIEAFARGALGQANRMGQAASDFVDDAKEVPEDFRRLREKGVGPGRMAAQAGRSFAKDSVGGGAEAVKGVSGLAATLNTILPEGLAEKAANGERLTDEEKMAFFQAGQAVQDYMERTLPDDPDLKGTFLFDTLPGALGSAVGFMLQAAAARGLGGSTTQAVGSSGALAQSSSARTEARAHGVTDPGKLAKVTGASIPLGYSEIFGVGSSIRRAFGGNALRGFRRNLVNIFSEMGEEALQEGAVQGIGGNVVAQRLYDENRELFEGVGESTAAGGIAGGLMALAVTALPGKYQDVQFTSPDQVIEALEREMADQPAPDINDPGEAMDAGILKTREERQASSAPPMQLEPAPAISSETGQIEEVETQKDPSEMTREEYDLWRVDELNRLNPQLGGALRGHIGDAFEGDVEASDDSPSWSLVGGYFGSLIQRLKNAKPGTFTHELRHAIDMLLGGSQVTKFVGDIRARGGIEALKKGLKKLRGKSGPLDPNTGRLTNDSEIANVVLDAYFRAREQLQEFAPDLVEFLDSMGAQKYAHLNKTSEEIGLEPAKAVVANLDPGEAMDAGILKTRRQRQRAKREESARNEPMASPQEPETPQVEPARAASTLTPATESVDPGAAEEFERAPAPEVVAPVEPSGISGELRDRSPSQQSQTAETAPVDADRTEQAPERLTPDAFRQQVRAVAKSDDEADAVSAIIEARAKASGESVEDYIGKRFAGVERGGEPGPGALRQTGEDLARSPEAQQFMEDSAVKDEAGNPRVVYNGNASDIQQFDPSKLGSTTTHPTARLGFFFSEHPGVSEFFADLAERIGRRRAAAAGIIPGRGEPRANILPAILSIKNPKVLTVKQFQELFGMDNARIRKNMEAAGYDGIKILADPKMAEAIERDPEFATEEGGEFGAVAWVAFYPGQIKSATGNRGTFDRGQNNILEQDAKGSVEFLEDGRAIIRAFEAADISTLVHEIGHVMRRDLSGDDLATVEEWAGVTDGTWTVAAEEKFARGFERYLADGTAPTRRLRRVFSKMAQWLRDIYGAIQGSAIDIEISPEVRAVMDRVLGGKGAEAASGPPGDGPVASGETSRPDNTTSARKADIARDREVLGLNEIDSPERREWAEALDAARERGIPSEARQLADEVIESPRALDDIETAGMTLRMADLKNQHRALLDTIKDESVDEAARDDASAKLLRVEAEFETVSRAVRISGTEKGRALASQKLTLDESFDLVSVLARAKRSKGAELTPKERAKFEKRVAELEKVEEELRKENERLREEALQKMTEARRRHSRKTSPADLEALARRRLAKAEELLKAGCGLN